MARGKTLAAPGGQRSTAYRFGLIHIGMDGNIMFHMSRSIFIICMHIPGITLTSSRTPPHIPATPGCWKYAPHALLFDACSVGFQTGPDNCDEAGNRGVGRGSDGGIQCV